ncbi:uncharacterized protein N7503_006498 [Penicillium pulvis]|uniref:uncharacterized protein n=1 Tax=Penicillium pulvis TaxID=1562058 RepID=UPI0025465D24|nr:uncharacterized protein N7503_006498 [Penicillium pulvis]KAJ5798993.1 hypothetical protein N7503_006498 [Penicillium pulvis]
MTAKLSIPRLRSARKENAGGRTSRACETCRERKHKCDGARPTCSQCLGQGLGNCFYPERTIVQQQKAIVSMRGEIQNYRELLQEISPELRGPTADRVARALKRPNQEKTTNRDCEISSSSSLASSEQIDVANEDFNRNQDSRATGFMGNNSEIAWMQRLDLQTSRHDIKTKLCLKPGFQPLIGNTMASLNYHLDHQSISNKSVTNSFALPQKVLADSLFQLYMEHIQEFLPIIRKDLFVAQYRQCFSREGNFPGRKWLAVLNMVLAIACAFSRLSGRELSPEADENVFSARARSLSISDNVIYDHGDLQQVQAEALMAFLFLIQSQINRSWKMIGIATRSGITLGLNLEKRIIGLDVKSGEARKQLWWSIFRLESLLSTMTGRVSCLGNASKSASPPFLNPNLDFAVPDMNQPTNELQWTINLSEETANSQSSFLKSLEPTNLLYCFYMADLALITHTITNEVYALEPFRIGWSRIESRIAFYRKKLDFWASTIHTSFGFQNGQVISNPRGSPLQFSLALNYYSAHILLNRPCLNGPAFEKKHDSRDSGLRFANKVAFNCLQASLGAIAQLPDQPDLPWCYQLPQWWDILHILTQSIAILLLDISIGPAASTQEIQHPAQSVVWAGVTKGLYWLHCLRRTSESASRGFEFFNSCVQRLDPDKTLDFECISLVFDPSRTPCDPKASGLQDILETNTITPPEEYGRIDYTEHSGRYFSATADEDAVPFQDLSGVQRPSAPSALAVLDTGEKVLDLVSNPDIPLEDVILSLVDGFYS